MKFNLSLRTKILFGALAGAVIAVVALTLLSYFLSRASMTDQAGRALKTLAESQALTIGNEINSQIEIISTLGQNNFVEETAAASNDSYPDPQTAQAQINQLDVDWKAAVENNNSTLPIMVQALDNDLAHELLNFQNSFPDHVEIFVTDKFGAEIASTNLTSDYNQADEEWWQIAYNNGTGALFIGQPEFDDSSQTYAVNMALPIKDDESGQIVGILRSTFSLAGLNQIVTDITYGDTGEADLLFPSGDLLRVESEVDKAADLEIITKLTSSPDGYLTSAYEGKSRLISYAVVSSLGSDTAIKDLGWQLITHQDTAEVSQPVKTQTRNILLAGLSVFLIAIGIAIFASRSLAKPIVELTGIANQFAGGDLSARAKVVTNDEIGELAGSFNNLAAQLQDNLRMGEEQRQLLTDTVEQYATFTRQVMQGKLTARLTLNGKEAKMPPPLIQLAESLNEMTASLHRMIAQTREAASNLSSAATEILAATTQQSSGATEQSAAITQTTSTVNEVKTISEHSTARLNDVANTSQRTVEVSRYGQKSVQDMIESMAQIKERVEAIAENTLALSEQTQQIGEIITTVNEIAAQSNILALNASVEAARAGEHGKGFAVVAMEVRNLAEQSKQATAQVKTILSEIQKATNLTVMATEEGAKGVDAGVQLAAQARESIDKLSATVNEATQVATQVVAGGQQLQTGIEQIAMAIQQINQVTVQSLASTRQTEKSAQNLNDLAHRLTDDIAQYEL